MQSQDWYFKPVNEQQRKAEADWKKGKEVMLLYGEAGSGKTHLAIAFAMQAVMKGEANRIILTRPTVTAGGEQLGYLPGNVDEKMLPWLMPIHDVLRRLTFKNPTEWIAKHCEVVPLAFMRGRTFDRAIAILDEAQNCTYPQLKLFLTRIGHKGRLILSGDDAQSDLGYAGCPFTEVIKQLHKYSHPSVAVHYLTSPNNPRHPLINHITKIL